MTFKQRVEALASAIGGKIKDLYTKQGTLTGLSTTEKSTLVGAINEVNAKPSGGAAINDATPSGSTTYSGTKIESVATAAAAAVKTEILGGASSAYDTLMEIQAELGDNDTSIANLLTAVGNRIRYDAAQTLTVGQQNQACANLGIGDPDTDFVATFDAALV